MKRIKLLPSILMLVLCVGILAIGVYAASPITGTIAGTINITAAQGVKIAVYEGKSTNAEDLIQNTFGSAEVELNAGGTTLNASSAIIPEEVAVKYYTVVLSTNQSICYVVDTETIEVFDGVTASGEKVSGAAVVTKTHKPTEDSVDYKGRPCLANDKPYTIQIAVHCGKILTEAINVSYDINIALHKDDDFAAEELNGIDYLYFGEYPQSEADVSDLTLTADGVFYGYDDDPETGGGKIARSAFTDGTNRYVLFESKYYLIEPLKWRILNQESDGTTRLLCDTVVEQVCYQQFRDVAGGAAGAANDYAISTLRGFLTNIFYYSSFNTSEQTLIIEKEIDDDELFEADPIYEKVFAMSTDEVSGMEEEKISNMNVSDYAVATGAGTNNGFWWTRTPSLDDWDYAEYVENETGDACDGYDMDRNDGGCVPAMVLGL